MYDIRFNSVEEDVNEVDGREKSLMKSISVILIVGSFFDLLMY